MRRKAKVIPIRSREIKERYWRYCRECFCPVFDYEDECEGCRVLYGADAHPIMRVINKTTREMKDIVAEMLSDWRSFGWWTCIFLSLCISFLKIGLLLYWLAFVHK